MKPSRKNGRRPSQPLLIGPFGDDGQAQDPTTQRLALILRQVEQSLFFAASSGALALALQQALGVDTGSGKGLALLQTWQSREEPRGLWSIPSIDLVSADVLPAQRGAYVADLNVILLNRQWLATATNAEVMAVILEEYGHALDRVFNPVDSSGDEGALFKDLVLGTPASPGDYAEDQFEVVLNGRTFLAEAAAGLNTTVQGAYTGTADDDTITGSAGNDTLDGAAGDDLILGAAGNDSLLGGNGNDTLRGGAGNDTINGGAGFDILDLSDATGPLRFTLSNNSATAATVSDTVTGGIGTDTYTLIEGVIAGSGNDSITGSASGDLLAGGGGNDTLNGAAGNDTLRGGSGDDVIDGGAGTDLLDLSDAKGNLTIVLSNNSTIPASVADGIPGSTGAIGKDTYTNIEGVIGGSGADTITGSAGADLLAGGGGADSLIGGAGNDTLRGGSGDDVIDGGTESDILDLSDATAALNLTFTPGAGTIAGAASGLGTDRYTGIEGLQGSGFDDVLTAGAAGSLLGGDGNDTLRGSIGNDTLIGGAGIDVLDFSARTTGLTFTFNSLGTTTFTGGAGVGTDIYSQIEGVIAGSGADSLTGSSLGDLFAGGTGNDTLRGGGGNDTLRGGSGNDSIDGGAGIDVLDLSDARNNLSIALINNGTTATAIRNTDTTAGSIGSDSYIGIEGVFAGSGNDTLVGSVNADWLRGGDGNDVLRQSPTGQANTSAAGDTLEGGLGNDEYQLTSNSSATVINDIGGTDIVFYMPVAPGTFVVGSNIQGVDTISLDPYSTVSGSGLTGDALNNLLVGSLGSDILSGGGGNDTISGSGGSDTINGGVGTDTILVTQPNPTLVSNAPISMDMNGDGTITYVGRSLSRADFNFSDDDKSERVAWVANGDGLLAIDTKGDRRIDKKNEIAFTSYDSSSKTDLEGLRRAFDTNKNGFLDAGDSKFRQFGVWVDNNLRGGFGDGICQTGEFKYLWEQGISRIKLTPNAVITPYTVATADNDVTVFGQTQFTINGAQRLAEDVRFATRLPSDATVVNATDFASDSDIILATGFIQKGQDLNTSAVKVWASTIPGGLGEEVPLNQGYNFVYVIPDGWLLYFGTDTENYNRGNNAPYFISVIPSSSFGVSPTAAITPQQKLDLENRIKTAIQALPSNLQTTNPQANGAAAPVNFAPDIRNNISADPSTPSWSNAQVTVSGGTEDNAAAAGTLNAIDLNTQDEVVVTVDAVSTAWTQRTGTPAITSPLSIASFRSMLDVRDIYGNRNPTALAADPFLGSNLNWTFNQGDAGVTNPYGSSYSFDWLAAGESIALTYTIKVTDNSTTSPPQLSDTHQVRITVAGVNDGPTITSGAQSGGVTEDTGITAGNLSTSGTIAFRDLDLTDTHTASFVLKSSDATANLPGFAEGIGTAVANIGSFALTAVSESNADTIPSGSVGWSYTLANGNPTLQSLAAGQTITQIYTVTVTDNNNATVSQDVTVSLTGVNDGPTIVAGSTTASAGLIEEAASTLAAAGTITFADVDLIDTHTASFVLKSSDATANLPGFAEGIGIGAANIGSFALTPVSENNADTIPSGSVDWSYSLANSDTTLQSLAAGQTLTQIYTVTVSDNNNATVSQDVTITLTGVNDEVLLTGVLTSGDVVEDGTPSATGTVTFTDVDLIDVHLVTTASVSSTYATPMGTFTAVKTTDSTGTGTGGLVTWSYAIDNDTAQQLADGQVVTEVHRITVDDQKGDTTTEDVTVTITGTNDAPTITLLGTDAEGAVTEDASPLTLSDSGTILFNDIDLVDVHTASVTPAVGNTLGGTLTLDPVSESPSTEPGSLGWTYSLANSASQFLADGQTATESFTVTIEDGNGGSVDQLVTVTITGTNDGPVLSDTTDPATVAELADASAQDLAAITGSFALSDPDIGDTLTASVLGSPTVLLNGSPFTLPSGATALIAAGAFVVTPTTQASNGGSVTAISYTYDPDAADLDFLSATDSLTITYQVKVSDGLADAIQDVTFTITGTSEPLFTQSADTVDFNTITLADFYPGTYADALGGNDTVVLLSGSNALPSSLSSFSGGDGNDTISGSGTSGLNNLATGSISGGAGNDSIKGTATAAGTGLYNDGVIDGGEGDNSIEGSFGDNGLYNGGVITNGTGNDRIAGDGNLYGIRNNGSIDSGDGNNSFIGSAGASGSGIENNGTITGGSLDDILTATGGFSGIDNRLLISTGNGNDTISGISAGANGIGIRNSGTISGGQGDDILSGAVTTATFGNYRGISNSGLLEGGAGNDTIMGSVTTGDGIYNTGTITGGDGDDVIIGSKSGAVASAINNTGLISTDAGDDIIDALQGGFIGGTGTIDLGDGNDTLKGFGNGTFIGGAGTDYLVFGAGTGTYDVDTTLGTITKSGVTMNVNLFDQISFDGGTSFNPLATGSFLS